MSVAVIFPKGYEFKRWKESDLGSPFEKETIRFLDAFSRALLANVEAREYPELIALGYWLRSANLLHIQKEHIVRERMYRAVGNVFHLAPGNVETLFFYSGVISLLMGNRNIIRVSSKRGRSLNIILTELQALYSEERYHPVANRFVLVDFQRDSRYLGIISGDADLRVLWGNDATIEHIRKVPIPAHAREITFPSKFSFSLLSAKAILSEDDLSSLVIGFANDAFMFAQQACSSPRCVIWLGSVQEVENAKEKFWESLEMYLRTPAFKHHLAIGDQYKSLLSQQKVLMCHRGQCAGNNNSKWFNRITIESIRSKIEKIHPGCGLFYEIEIGELDELYNKFNNQHQTISFWGLNKEKLLSWIESNRSLGVDKVTPVGNSLDFQVVWDGIDLISAFSRQSLR